MEQSNLINNTIYKLIAGQHGDEKYPRVDCGNPRNDSSGLYKASQMFDGKVPLDSDFILRCPMYLNANVDDYDIFHGNTLSNFVVSEKAKSFIESLGINGQEFVPCYVNNTLRYYWLIQNEVNCLDRENSTLEDWGITRITNYVFKKKDIKKGDIFHLPENKGIFFVTQKIKNDLEASGLNGFHFIDYENPPEDHRQWMV